MIGGRCPQCGCREWRWHPTWGSRCLFCGCRRKCRPKPDNVVDDSIPEPIDLGGEMPDPYRDAHDRATADVHDLSRERAVADIIERFRAIETCEHEGRWSRQTLCWNCCADIAFQAFLDHGLVAEPAWLYANAKANEARDEARRKSEGLKHYRRLNYDLTQSLETLREAVGQHYVECRDADDVRDVDVRLYHVWERK